MKLLLDAHILIWALADAPKLPQKARQLILDEGNELYASTVRKGRACPGYGGSLSRRSRYRGFIITADSVRMVCVIRQIKRVAEACDEASPPFLICPLIARVIARGLLFVLLVYLFRQARRVPSDFLIHGSDLLHALAFIRRCCDEPCDKLHLSVRHSGSIHLYCSPSSAPRSIVSSIIFPAFRPRQ